MRPFDGSPDSWGATKTSRLPHAGPASYVVVTVGVAPACATGGDTLEAVSAGMKWLDYVIGGITDTGHYRVDAIPKHQSGATQGQQSTSYTLKWTSLVTASLGGQSQVVNTEAIVGTDLSAEIVRLLAIGPK